MSTTPNPISLEEAVTEIAGLRSEVELWRNRVSERIDMLDAERDRHVRTSADLRAAEERIQNLTEKLNHWRTQALDYQRALHSCGVAQARAEGERDALLQHLEGTGDDAMKDLLRQYLYENDCLAETARKLTERAENAEAELARVAGSQS